MKSFGAIIAGLTLATVAQPALAAADLAGRIVFSGHAVPGATVTATRGGRSVATLSDDEGVFRLQNLEDGVWSVRVEMRGFVTMSRDVTVPFTDPALSFALVMRPYEEIVGAGTPLRDAPTPPAVSAAPPDAPDIINGSLINGAASAFAQPRAFGNNRPAQRPLYTGGITAVLGSSAWNARPYSFTGGTGSAPSSGDVQLGFTLIGPLKIPWVLKSGPQTALSYQHGVTHSATSQSALMPTAAQRAGDVSGLAVAIRDPLTGLPFAGNAIPAGRISPQASSLLAYFPLPNSDMNDGANYHAPVLTESVSDAIQININHNLTPRTTIGATLGFQRSRTHSLSIFDFTDVSTQSSLHATLTATRRVSSRLQVSARYQLMRSATTTTPFFAHRANVSGDAGITGNSQAPANWGPPALLFPDFADLRDGDPQDSIKLTHSGSVEALVQRRRHNIKAGGGWRWDAVDVSSQPDPRGTLTFTGAATGSAFADFLLGIPATSSIGFGESATRLRGAAFDAFVNDDFRIGAGITMSIGLRWEYEAPFTEKAGRLVNLDAAPDFSAVRPVVASLIRPDTRGFQPRVAMSWRPMLGSSLVLKAGYGLYRNLGVYQPLALMLAQQPPFTRTVSVQNGPQTPLTLGNPFPVTASSANTFGVDPNFRAAYLHSWQASAQRDFPASLTVIAAYFGDRGTDLTQAFLPNTYPPGAANPCPSCPSGFVYLTSNGTSLRNAGQFTLRRRLHAGFTATVQYTIAKSTDNAATFSNTVVRPSSLSIAQNWLNLDGERGPSSFDQRHLLSVQAQYTTGVGVTGGTLADSIWGSIYKDWTATAQLTAGSGLPLTPVYFAAVPGTGFVGVRPSLTGAPIGPVTPGSYANPAAFTAPAPGTWGDAGRNSIRGPRQFSLDANISRVFRLRGRLNLEWRIAATNVLNRVTFASINTIVTSPQFGRPTVANSMRRVTTTLRLRF
jgi:hypothetical protein